MRKAWVISVDMGYGHQRAAYPLKDIAYKRIITANSDSIVTPEEAARWHRFRAGYEWVSRVRSIPFIGRPIWAVYDRFQAIRPFYPLRDLSPMNFGAFYAAHLIRKGLCRALLENIRRKKLPLVSTFFAVPLAADYHGIKNVFCVVTDTDVNRVWAPAEPKKSRITYLVPTRRCGRRLEAYGVGRKRIFYTGFPLPKENTGKNLQILKRDLGARLINLDPGRRFIRQYKLLIKQRLGKHFMEKSTRPLTITFATGGAGAEKEIGSQILESLKTRIKKHEIRLNLAAGTRPEVYEHFMLKAESWGLKPELGKHLHIQFAMEKKSHFQQFNSLLHTTDILWSKPSELSFYTALGIPMIIAPALGKHEELNQRWLQQKGSGFPQEAPVLCNEWLFDWIEAGFLAEAAWDAFMEEPKFGTYNIEQLLFAKDKKKARLRY